MQLDDLRRLYKLMRMPIQGSDLQAAQRLKRSKVAKPQLPSAVSGFARALSSRRLSLLPVAGV